MRRIDIVYVKPVGNHRVFESRFHDVVKRYDSFVHVLVGAGELALLTREAVFVSNTQPNVVVIRDGEVVAHGIGELSMREIERLIGGIIDQERLRAIPARAA